jgi:hypothetical protein
MMKYGPYSHSRIQTGHCPFAFDKRYRKHERGVSRGNAGFGKVIHLIVADVIKAQVRQDAYDVSELMNKHITHDLLPRIREMQDILHIFSHRFEFNRHRVVGVEENIAIDFEGNEAKWEDSYLRGVLDIIEIEGNHVTITDHKTQYNILSKEQMDTNSQLTMYCYLAKCLYPQLEKFTVKIYFARYGAYRTSQRTLEDLDKFRQEVDITINQIEAIEEWVPIAGANCAFCEFIHSCPLAQYDPKGMDPPEVLTDEQAVKEARLIRVREEQVKRAKERLKAYCSANGDVQVSGDYAFGFVANSTVNWSPKTVKEVFERHGHEIDGHISFSKTSLRRLISQAKRLDPEFADDLERAGSETQETRFKGFKL